ncbi:MAG: hypothetical protein PHS32_11020 [Rhodoferax sp.]|uniref:NACHT domain-containing protein n=1 Tax=Rhodoferax sp. TaxID=50421 RepID=UPI0026170FF1|nr:hypothetical protein [Rhodoferax sp.]MDD5334264.1 hypothetical protein [Rhodoferax sp.]
MNTLAPHPQEERLPLERVARARENDDSLTAPRPLSHYRDVPAWVLLADPGAGKSDVFNTLSLVEGGTCVSAREFVGGGLPVDWQQPLFIDGLDEITAGSSQGASLFDQIRQKLRQLDTPKFRISCREADWRGNADGEALQRLVGSGKFVELHLAPLTHAQSVTLIAHWQPCTEAQAEVFMQEAERRDLRGLLDNPQTLRLLVKAMGAAGKRWPDNKTETYERACAQLVREPNPEHLANTRDSTPSDDQVLLAAGYLSAVMLLSGSGAIALQRRSEPRAGVMSLPELLSAASAPGLSTCRFALHSRLFRGPSDFSPVHRTVAEYLGARYLAQRIHLGLPASRVLALMLGQDAGIVPELRGLHAWLAAVAPANLRRELIAHDPLGVVLNGDVRAFHRTDKLAVLSALQHEAEQDPSFRRGNWTGYPFGALATADMEGDFKALLKSTDRSPAHQSLIHCMLDALAHGQHMPALAPELEQVVRDKTYWPPLRIAALRVVVTYAQVKDDKVTLKTLLVDVHANVVEDQEDELLGTLLQALYPTHISPTELLRHFRQPRAEFLSGSYRRFWRQLAKGNIPEADVSALLDALHATGYRLPNQRDRLRSSEIVGELLVRGVTQDGTQVDVPRLYNWLSLGLDSHLHCRLNHENKAALRQWFETNPAQYRAVFEYELRAQASMGDRSGRNLWGIRARLYSASPPEDASSWYLSLAESCADVDLQRHLIRESSQLTSHRCGPDAAIELLEKWSTDHPVDAAWVADELQCPYPPSESVQQDIDFEIAHNAREAEETRQTITFFRETLPSFVKGPAHLGALVEVANAYLDIYSDSTGETPDERLRSLLNANEAWVELALHGLRQTLFRFDLPSAADIIDLEAKGQRHNLALPCLAAMEMRYAEDPLSALDLPPATLETIIAFRLTHDYNESPAWFKQLLAQQPTVLAGVMQQMMSAQIVRKKEHVNGASALAHDATYAEVARKIVPQLIADFPLKASRKHLQTLRNLVSSVVRQLDRNTQLRLIASKLRANGMDVAQRVYWLTAGVQLAPDLYLHAAIQYIGKTQARAGHLFDLIHEQREFGGVQVNLSTAAQAFLIGLLGPRVSPRATQSGVYRVTPEMEMGRYVESLIATLAGNPDETALQALTSLQQRQDLKQWKESFDRAIYEQRIVRRKALFQQPSVTQVCATLANLQPANVADLWALTVDHLTQLASEIRLGSTNDYRQYWANKKPKLEDDCRDALLSDLKTRLATLGVAAEREGHYADAKRADIKIIAGSLHLAIEIKCEWHAHLWKAIQEQLIAKYGRESASDGFGIYLVFWFSGKLKPGARDGGAKPKTPQELEQRLSATVPEELRHKIAVLVVDCSQPPATKRRMS